MALNSIDDLLDDFLYERAKHLLHQEILSAAYKPYTHIDTREAAASAILLYGWLEPDNVVNLIDGFVGADKNQERIWEYDKPKLFCGTRYPRQFAYEGIGALATVSAEKYDACLNQRMASAGRDGIFGMMNSLAYRAWCLKDKPDDDGFFRLNEEYLQKYSRKCVDSDSIAISRILSRSIAAAIAFAPDKCFEIMIDRIRHGNWQVRSETLNSAYGFALVNKTSFVDKIISEWLSNNSLSHNRRILALRREPPRIFGPDWRFDSFVDYVRLCRDFHPDLPVEAKPSILGTAYGKLLRIRAVNICDRKELELKQDPAPEVLRQFLALNPNADLKRANTAAHTLARSSTVDVDHAQFLLTYYQNFGHPLGHEVDLQEVVELCDIHMESYLLFGKYPRGSGKAVYLAVDKESKSYLDFFKGTSTKLDFVVIKLHRPTEKGSDLLKHSGQDALANARKLSIDNLLKSGFRHIAGNSGVKYDKREKCHYWVEEVCGNTLKQEIKRGRIGFVRAREYLYQIIQGEYELLCLGFTNHGDLKSENIAITKVPIIEHDLIKILDVDHSGYTGSEGYHIGYPFATAPEILDEDKAATFKTDLFTIGCLYYQMLTGSLPIETYFNKHPDRQPVGIPEPGSNEWNNMRYDQRRVKVDRPIKKIMLEIGEAGFWDLISEGLKATNLRGYGYDESMQILKCLLSYDPAKRRDPFNLLNYPFYGYCDYLKEDPNARTN